MKRLLPAALILALLVSAVVAIFWYQYQQFLQRPLQLVDSGTVIMVEPGSNLRTVVTELEQRGVTRLDWRWRLLSRLEPVTIKAGEYELPYGLRPAALLALLASGNVVSYRFTIVEGWSLKQLLDALRLNPVLQHTVDGAADLEGLPEMPPENPEGWFLPETYVFTRGDTDLHILRRAYAAMLEELEKVWAGRDIGLPYETQYELLTMASIIEKETWVPEEQPRVAGVFMNRLKKGMRLQTDPTVIYGVGAAYDGDITRQHLKTDTPYNTYTRSGLTPTPISLPGEDSLLAAVDPEKTDAYYFVAMGGGRHKFSKTLEEHNRAVRKYILGKSE